MTFNFTLTLFLFFYLCGRTVEVYRQRLKAEATGVATRSGAHLLQFTVWPDPVKPISGLCRKQGDTFILEP